MVNVSKEVCLDILAIPLVFSEKVCHCIIKLRHDVFWCCPKRITNPNRAKSYLHIINVPACFNYAGTDSFSHIANNHMAVSETMGLARWRSSMDWNKSSVLVLLAMRKLIDAQFSLEVISPKWFRAQTQLSGNP